MNERDFYYWLQGYFELSGSKTLDEEQVKMVKEHMALVATKVTKTVRTEEQATKKEQKTDLPPIDFQKMVDKIFKPEDEKEVTTTCFKPKVTFAPKVYCDSRTAKLSEITDIPTLISC